MELLRNAWLGWATYIQQGKLVILLPVALLLFLFYKKDEMIKTWTWYATIMTIACICPVTAAVLMRYQTAFYGYSPLWSGVPATAMIACGITFVLWHVWTGREERSKTYAVGVTVLLGMILLLCGSLGVPAAEQNGTSDVYQLQEQEKLETAIDTVEKLRVICGEEAEIVLWAPTEIVTVARVADSSIVLLYGRNMWDKSLNAYAYDVYAPEVEFLYRCMRDWEQSEDAPQEEKISPETLVGMARENGVNCILLPKSMERMTVARMARSMGIRAQKLEAYWLLYE